MQLYSRIVVNLLVISVRTPVNLLVKLTRMKVRGAMGLWVRGIHLGEARTISNYHETIMRLIVLLEDMMGMRL